MTDSIIGNITPPSFLQGDYATYQTGITAFISNLLKLLTIAAGLFALVNFILAGFQYLTAAGDEKVVQQAWKQIYLSLIGLVIIVLAYALTALISFLLFGDASIILRPKVYGPGIQ